MQECNEKIQAEGGKTKNLVNHIPSLQLKYLQLFFFYRILFPLISCFTTDTELYILPYVSWTNIPNLLYTGTTLIDYVLH